jgi:hypothetical protein
MSEPVIKKHNRWAEIKYRKDGSTYFMRHGRRHDLNEFVVTRNNPWGGNESMAKLGYDAVMGTGYWTFLAIKLSNCGDSVLCHYGYYH